MLWLVAAVALATDPSTYRHLFDSAQNVGVRRDAIPLTVNGLHLDAGGVQIHMDSAIAVPLTSGFTADEWRRWYRVERLNRTGKILRWTGIPDPRLEPQVVGYVLLGDGIVEVPIANSADGWQLGNRLVFNGRQDEQSVREDLEDAVWEVSVDEVILRGMTRINGTSISGPRSRRARRKARRRVRRELDETDRVTAWQRLLDEGLGDGREPVVQINARATERLGIVSRNNPKRRVHHNQWVHATWDPDAVIQPLDALTVTATGRRENWGSGHAFITAFPHAEGRAFQATTVAVYADTDLRVQVDPRDTGTLATGRSVLTLQATRPTRVLELSIPRHDQEPEKPWQGWSIDAVTLTDGTRLRWWEPDFLYGTSRSGWTPLFFPRLLEEGEQVDVVVEWTGGWPTAHGARIADVIPNTMPERYGNPWRHTTRVAVGPDDHANPLAAVIGGDQQRIWEEYGWQLTEATSGARVTTWPEVAVGRWSPGQREATDVLPAVDVRFWPRSADRVDAFAAETQRVVDFYQGLLPPLPLRTVRLVLGGRRNAAEYSLSAPYGMVQPRTGPEASWSGRVPHGVKHYAVHSLAHEVAEQYFAHVLRPATEQDAWMAQSLSETFALLYMEQAVGERAAAVRFDRYQAQWEREFRHDHSFASLTRPYAYRRAITDHYGPVVLAMLRARIGTGAFFRTVRGLVDDPPPGPVSTDDLQRAFEATSQKDLSEFFDYWVRGGFRPKLVLRWSDSDGPLTLNVTSSVPFGRFDVPVEVQSIAGSDTHWVTVEDGNGTLTVDGVSGITRVLLDPEGRVVARRRGVRRQGTLRGPAEPLNP